MRIFEVVLPILFLAGAVLGGVFLLWPKYQNFADMQEAITEREERIQRGENLLVQLRDQKRQVEERQEDFARLEVAIPEDAALPGLYHDLQRLGGESGLVLSEITSEQEPVQEGNAQLSETMISLELEGSYAGVKRFIEQVHVFQRMLNVQSIVLEIGDEETGTLLLNAAVAAYSIPEQP